jgi:hypothetical protein
MLAWQMSSRAACGVCVQEHLGAGRVDGNDYSEAFTEGLGDAEERSPVLHPALALRVALR